MILSNLSNLSLQASHPALTASAGATWSRSTASAATSSTGISAADPARAGGSRAGPSEEGKGPAPPAGQAGLLNNSQNTELHLTECVCPSWST